MTNAREIYGMKWSEKEYLIVLHYYFEHKGEAQHADTPFVRDLSHLLGRTPHSILYRLQNFMSIDPDETDPRRKGKIHITDFGRRIFDEWFGKRDSLKDTAEAFIRDQKAQMTPDLFNPNPIKVPITFRGYELLDEIGRGGFGIVLSCLNTRDEKIHALKVIDNSKIYENDCVHRFVREIRTLKAIEHPNIIKIYEDNLEAEGGNPGFVMELAECDLPKYLSTKALKQPLHGQRPVLDATEASEIITAVMDGVDALHNSTPPIIHRDINPNNVLRLFNGTWVLADFSLAKFLPIDPVSTSFATMTNMAMGTGHYTAPEQYKSLKSSDVRSDIFSLGWLLWELFTSEGPYPSREPSGLRPKLEAVFLKATNLLPKNRFGSIEEMKKAFLNCW